MPLIRKLLLIVFLFLLVFTRFYNLEYTARFTEDESGFLVRVHQIYKERKLTLVGQLNEMGTKVFSSTTVYLLLPFAILGNFDPSSVFFGAAVWGVLTALAMLYLAKKFNKKHLVLPTLLILFWFPLVLTARWAWNPNFIPLWVSLGIISYLTKRPALYFLSGLFFGLSVHHHYYAIFACLVFIFIVSVDFLRKKQFKNIFLINSGFALALLPFIIFDLRHPPGIFLLGAAKQAQSASLSLIASNFTDYTKSIAEFYTQNLLLATALLVTVFFLFVFDVTKNKKPVPYFIVCLLQIIFMSILGAYFDHYFFVIIPFFFVWLIYPRKGVGKALSVIAAFILIVGGVLSARPLLTKSPVEPSLTTVKKVDRIIENEILKNNLVNTNIAVLASPDGNSYGRKYRDLLLVPYDISLLSKEEYPISDLLFVVSTSSEERVRKDPAYEVDNFRNGIVRARWEVDNWYVYLFAKK